MWEKDAIHFNMPSFSRYYMSNWDNQGGCCDNDVHEIFKCMEETVLKKAFLHEYEDGRYLCYSCQCSNQIITVDRDVEELLYYMRKPARMIVNNEMFDFISGAVTHIRLR